MNLLVVAEIGTLGARAIATVATPAIGVEGTLAKRDGFGVSLQAVGDAFRKVRHFSSSGASLCAESVAQASVGVLERSNFTDIEAANRTPTVMAETIEPEP